MVAADLTLGRLKPLATVSNFPGKAAYHYRASREDKNAELGAITANSELLLLMIIFTPVVSQRSHERRS